MPHTGEATTSDETNGVEVTGAGWLGLLGALSDEELAQYRQLALDQVRHEAAKWWINGVLLVLAVASGGWGLASWYQVGLWPRPFWALGVAGLASYWPWQSRCTERLWERHAVAVDAEIARRRADAAAGTGAAMGKG